MDKREIKSTDAIYESFRVVLDKKDFKEITIQDILDDANVSRSTFYAHFCTKEDLVIKVCDSIFDHIFSNSLEKEKDHDFSNGCVFNYTAMIIHMFYHFRKEEDLINEIEKSSAKEIFNNRLKMRLHRLISSCVSTHLFLIKDIPFELQVNQLSESFISLLLYWLSNGCKESPEEEEKCFEKLYSNK
jgi:hypothetical protein